MAFKLLMHRIWLLVVFGHGLVCAQADWWAWASLWLLHVLLLWFKVGRLYDCLGPCMGYVMGRLEAMVEICMHMMANLWETPRSCKDTNLEVPIEGRTLTEGHVS